jgi:hypothetical protein
MVRDGASQPAPVEQATLSLPLPLSAESCKLLFAAYLRILQQIDKFVQSPFG